jgi:[ribosomal protein S5]-alanine N-acetyltransferase
MRVLETPRLVLEPQVVAHAGELFAALSDPAIYEYENQPPASLDWLRQRLAKLETRQSSDAREQWLNWVVRPHGEKLIGYVQATVLPDRRTLIAYELASSHWGRGLGCEATRAMLDELRSRYGVSVAAAVFKKGNFRSRRLLERLGFVPVPAERYAQYHVEADEDLMLRDLCGVRSTIQEAG